VRRSAPLLGLCLAALAVSGAAADTTLDRRVVPGKPQNGFTRLVYGPGDRTLVRTKLAAPRPGRAKRRRSLVYFAQLSDFQLADEESPLRVEVLDQVNSAFSAAWRPQEALMPFVVDASVRQVNANRRSPIRGGSGRRARLALTLLTGDNADNQAGVETSWVARLMEGGPLNPNSGVVTDTSMQGRGCAAADRAALTAEAPKYTGVQDYDDYVESGTFYDPDQPLGQWAAFPAYPGLLDRAQQPFTATGLDVPSYVALGNHDGLVQGNQAAISTFSHIATGCIKVIAPAASFDDPLGPLAPTLLQSGPAQTMLVPPDPDRAPLTKPQYRHRFDDAHGFQHIDAAELAASRGAASYYSFSPRRGVRFVALDTIANAGIVGPGSEGNVDEPQFQWLEKTLDRADRRGELVILFSHHGPTSLSTDIGDEVAGDCDNPEQPSNAGCDLDPRSSTPMHLGADMVAEVLRHPHVVAWVAGHSHVNDVAFYGKRGAGFWVVRTSAEADYPHQDRLLELMDNRDGTLSLFGTLLDNAAPAEAPPPGPAAGFTSLQLASLARTLGYNDPQANLTAVGDPPDRNVELLVPDPRDQPLLARVRPRRLRAGHRTTLRIRVRRFGRPVRGARIRLDHRFTHTNARGRARLRVTLRRPGRRAVKVRKGPRLALARFRVVHSKR
jgi:metallophosphoesterase (TIGR03767 family)